MRSGAGVPPAVARAFCPRPAGAGRPSHSGRDARTTALGQNVHSTAGDRSGRAQHRPDRGTRVWNRGFGLFRLRGWRKCEGNVAVEPHTDQRARR